MADLSYVVSIKGEASPTLRSAFADCKLAVDHGVTLVHCPADALHAVMRTIQDLGLQLLHVRLVADDGLS